MVSVDVKHHVYFTYIRCHGSANLRIDDVLIVTRVKMQNLQESESTLPMGCSALVLTSILPMGCNALALTSRSQQPSLPVGLYLMFEHNYYTGYGVTGDVNRSSSCQNRTGV